MVWQYTKRKRNHMMFLGKDILTDEKIICGRILEIKEGKGDAKDCMVSVILCDIQRDGRFRDEQLYTVHCWYRNAGTIRKEYEVGDIFIASVDEDLGDPLIAECVSIKGIGSFPIKGSGNMSCRVRVGYPMNVRRMGAFYYFNLGERIFCIKSKIHAGKSVFIEKSGNVKYFVQL